MHDGCPGAGAAWLQLAFAGAWSRSSFIGGSRMSFGSLPEVSQRSPATCRFPYVALAPIETLPLQSPHLGLVT